MVFHLPLRKTKAKPYPWDLWHEEGREQILEWSKSRQRRLRGLNKTYRGFLVYSFNLNTLKSFIQNFNFMVLIQMGLAGLSVYIFQYFSIHFDVHVSLFVSPIVFPLAFSINTDFQRREKVLEDLANFKSAGMLWFFCMREWKEAAGLDIPWMNAVHLKLKSLLFHLREYLLTKKMDRRKIILNAMYEDFSDASQLIEEVRASKLPANTSIVSRAIHLLNMMSLSFERLRVIREYRSPRSIRSFNKVLILFLPIILGPYFVNQSLENGKVTHSWKPYYISILVSFVFSALQGVQDKLDDPFDGMSEDDIDLEQIDDWTFNSLEATVNRTFKVGRFNVNIDRSETIRTPRKFSVHLPTEQTDHVVDLHRKSTRRRGPSMIERHRSFKNPVGSLDSCTSLCDNIPYDQHPYADVLEKIAGNTTITRGTLLKQSESEVSLGADDSPPTEREKPIPIENIFKSEHSKVRNVSFAETSELIEISSSIEGKENIPLIPTSNGGLKPTRFSLTKTELDSSSSTDPPHTNTSSAVDAQISFKGTGENDEKLPLEKLKDVHTVDVILEEDDNEVFS